MNPPPRKSMLAELTQIRREFEKTYGKRPGVMSGEIRDLAALSRSLEGIVTEYSETGESALGGRLDTLYGIPIFAHAAVPPGVLRLYSPDGSLVGEITGLSE